MLKLVTTRALGAVLTVWVSSIVVFAMVRLVPGDPISARLTDGGFDPEVAEQLRQLYKLDQPLVLQYFDWLKSLASGNLGFSLLNNLNVAGELSQRIPRTLLLTAGGMTVALLIAIPCGIIAAHRRGTVDAAITAVNTVFLALPTFFIGLILILLFAVKGGVLPATGYVSPTSDIGDWLKSSILPWLTIGLPASAFISRVLRASLLDTLGQDYIRTAKSHGLTSVQILRSHAIRNAAIPTVTVVGMQVGYLLGGAIVVEVLFSYPGMGLLLVNAIIQRDYPVIQAAVLFFAVAFVIVNFVTDMIYSVLDPRLRAGSK